MSVDKQSVLEAVNDLIADPDPRPKVEALDVVFEVSNRHPVKLAAGMAVLNPLLRLRRENPQGWEGVKTLIDTKRAIKGLKPCWPAPEPESFDKPEYQRQLMAERRERPRRAVDLENMQRPAHAQLRGKPRLEYMDRTFAKWAAKRDRHLEACAEQKGSKLTREEAAQARDDFWRTVDRRMDEAEAAIRRELLKPMGQRRKVDID